MVFDLARIQLLQYSNMRYTQIWLSAVHGTSCLLSPQVHQDIFLFQLALTFHLHFSFTLSPIRNAKKIQRKPKPIEKKLPGLNWKRQNYLKNKLENFKELHNLGCKKREWGTWFSCKDIWWIGTINSSICSSNLAASSIWSFWWWWRESHISLIFIVFLRWWKNVSRLPIFLKTYTTSYTKCEQWTFKDGSKFIKLS